MLFFLINWWMRKRQLYFVTKLKLSSNFFVRKFIWCDCIFCRMCKLCHYEFFLRLTPFLNGNWFIDSMHWPKTVRIHHSVLLLMAGKSKICRFTLLDKSRHMKYIFFRYSAKMTWKKKSCTWLGRRLRPGRKTEIKEPWEEGEEMSCTFDQE